MFQIPYVDHVEKESVSTKCNKCDTVTEHQFLNIMPVDVDGTVNPLEMMQLVRRLMLCTQCGTMSLRK